jgi:hypothetical protein
VIVWNYQTLLLLLLLELPQHPVKTFGKQKNAKRWRRKENVKNPKLRPNAKRLVEFARYQEYIFFQIVYNQMTISNTL